MSSGPPLAHNARWTFIGPTVAGIVLSMLASFWMPWERVHPNDAGLRESLGYAPFWSHQFDNIVGARIDWFSFFINLAVIWVVSIAAALMLKVNASHD
jgi:hypothetical protein